MIELLMLASVAFAAGFGTGWTLRWIALRCKCQTDNSGDFVAVQGLTEFDRYPKTLIVEPEEIVELTWPHPAMEHAWRAYHNTPIGGRSS